MNRQEHDQAVRNLAEMPAPALGIDLDGCVDEAPIFFPLLTSRWPGKVFVMREMKKFSFDATPSGSTTHQSEDAALAGPGLETHRLDRGIRFPPVALPVPTDPRNTR